MLPSSGQIVLLWQTLWNWQHCACMRAGLQGIAGSVQKPSLLFCFFLLNCFEVCLTDLYWRWRLISTVNVQWHYFVNQRARVSNRFKPMRICSINTFPFTLLLFLKGVMCVDLLGASGLWPFTLGIRLRPVFREDLIRKWGQVSAAGVQTGETGPPCCLFTLLRCFFFLFSVSQICVIFSSAFIIMN